MALFFYFRLYLTFTLSIIGYIITKVNKNWLILTSFLTDKVNMDFYDRVKELTKQKNLSLITFLQSLGINYETYKSAKRIGRLPRTDESLAIAGALNTTVEYLVTGSADSPLRDEVEVLHSRIDGMKRLAAMIIES